VEACEEDARLNILTLYSIPCFVNFPLNSRNTKISPTKGRAEVAALTTRIKEMLYLASGLRILTLLVSKLSGWWAASRLKVLIRRQRSKVPGPLCATNKPQNRFLSVSD
jgi:hypothetical protein